MRRDYVRTDLRFAAGAGVARACADMAGMSPGLSLLNTPRIARQVPVGRSVRDVVPLRSGGTLVVYVGLVRHDRGLEQILDAMRLAPEVELAIVGGSMRNIDYDVDAEIAARGLASRVHHVGFQPQEELLAFVATADVGLATIPPVTENNRATLPAKFLEMLLAGLPVIVYDFGPMAELARDIASCRCVPYGDATVLAEAVRAVAADAGMRPSSTQLERLRRQLGWEAQEQVLLEAYARLLSTGPH